MRRKLYRDTQAGALSGVCAGLGEYLQIDATWIRLFFVLSVLLSPALGVGLLGLVIYIVLWIVVPAKPPVEQASEYPYGGAYPPPRDAEASAEPVASGTAYDVDYRVDPIATSHAEADFHQGNSVKQSRISDRTLVGLILVAVGVLFLLHQLEVFYWRHVTRYWPVALIVVGIAIVLDALRRRERPDASANPGVAARDSNVDDESQTNDL